MFARLRNVYPAHLMSAALDHLSDVRRDAAHVRFVKPGASHHDLQLIQVWLFPQLRQRVEVDVAVDGVLHTRLGLAHVFHRAAETQRPLISSGGLDRHRIADARPGDLDGVALNQYLAGSWRPYALLRLQRADSNVAE